MTKPVSKPRCRSAVGSGRVGARRRRRARSTANDCGVRRPGGRNVDPTCVVALAAIAGILAIQLIFLGLPLRPVVARVGAGWADAVMPVSTARRSGLAMRVRSRIQGSRHSIGARPASIRAVLVRLNGLLPKKPLWALSGDGCADSITV